MFRLISGPIHTMQLIWIWDNNWGYFPSVSAGWTVTNENFMQDINRDFLSSLKLRASYGKNGSISNLGGYMYAATLNSSPTLYAGQFVVENYKNLDE